MAKLLGYNRWPRAWPAHIPLWARYPIVMDNAGTWPYEWKIERELSTLPWPSEFPRYSIATYDFTQGDITTWRLRPTLVGGLTVTFFSVRIIGTLAKPIRYERYFSILQQTGPDWHSTRHSVSWKDPAGNPGARQHEIAGITIFEGVGNQNAANFLCRAAAYCGEEWPPMQ